MFYIQVLQNKNVKHYFCLFSFPSQSYVGNRFWARYPVFIDLHPDPNSYENALVRKHFLKPWDLDVFNISFFCRIMLQNVKGYHQPLPPPVDPPLRPPWGPAPSAGKEWTPFSYPIMLPPVAGTNKKDSIFISINFFLFWRQFSLKFSLV